MKKVKIDARAMRAVLVTGNIDAALAMLDAAENVKKGRPEIWPWATMGIGEAFEMNGVRLASARVAAVRAGRRLGRGFRASGRDGDVFIVRTE